MLSMDFMQILTSTLPPSNFSQMLSLPPLPSSHPSPLQNDPVSADHVDTHRVYLLEHGQPNMNYFLKQS